MLKAAVLGATGNVGQIFVQLLEGHPWFEVTTVAASKRSTGRTYGEASRWRQSTPVPDAVAQMEVVDINPRAVKDVDIVFSALPSDVARKVEEDFGAVTMTVIRIDPVKKNSTQYYAVVLRSLPNPPSCVSIYVWLRLMRHN